MPTYTAACLECGAVQDYFRKLAESSDTPDCCDKKMTKMLSTPMVGAMNWTGHKGFHAPDGVNGVGTWIESGSDYMKYLDRNELVPASEGEQEAKIQKANRAAEYDRKLSDKVLEAYRKHSNL